MTGIAENLAGAAQLPERDTVDHHVNALRAAGTDRPGFETAFSNLKSSRLSAADHGEVARQYADTVSKYKSKTDAHQDIFRAFIRNARFENKLK